MKTSLKISIVAAALSLAMSAMAQEDNVIKIATGGSKGTYTKIFASLQAVCGEPAGLQLMEVPSGGSDDNIDKMLAKQADAGFVQIDTLKYMENIDGMRVNANKLRVLFPLYPEEVHVVALKSLAKITGGVSFFGRNMGGDKVALSDLAELNGLKVGAWGGSVTTATAIRVLSNGSVTYEVVPFKDSAEAWTALSKGEIGAVIAVGGQPMDAISGLGPHFKLLTVNRALAEKVRAYVPTTVTYKNVGAVGLNTVATHSAFVTKNLDPKFGGAKMAKLKACVLKNETTFKQGTGHHAKWEDVDFTVSVPWPMYETGAVSAKPVKK